MSDFKQKDALMSGALWEQFCDTLKQTGEQILGPETPASSLSDFVKTELFLQNINRQFIPIQFLVIAI